MYVTRSIPDDVLGRVRSGARSALLEPLAALRTLSEHDPGCARRPYTDELLGQIERLVCLLDAIGWSAGAGVPETAIDIDEDGPALCEALSEAMRVATVELKNTEPCKRRQVKRAVLPLATFGATVEAASLERAGRDPDVHMFQEDLQVFLAEMEHDEHRSPRTECARKPSRRHDDRRSFQKRSVQIKPDSD